MLQLATQDRSSLRPFFSYSSHAEVNGVAKLFVLGGGPFRVRRRGETRRVEAETWRRARRSLKPDGKSTVQVAQRAIAPPTVSWSAPVGAKLAFTPTIKRGSFISVLRVEIVLVR